MKHVILLAASGIAAGFRLPVGGTVARRVRLPALSAASSPFARAWAPAMAEEGAREEVNLAETAMAAIDSCMQMLEGDTEPPQGLLPLKNAVAEGESLGIGAALYELLIEQCLEYEMTEDKTMVKGNVDYSNMEDPKVREKIGYIYSYGISMFQRGFIAEDKLKDVRPATADQQPTRSHRHVPTTDTDHLCMCVRVCTSSVRTQLVLNKVASRVGMDGPKLDQWLNMPAVQ
jgi:hypothetical protein